MTRGTTKSSPPMDTSERKKLVREKFVLLARVGQHKRKASRLHDEAEFLYSIVTGLLVALGVASDKLQSVTPKDDPETAQVRSEHIRLVRQLLSFWPKDSESQDRLLKLLDCDGLATMTELTDEGYVILSSDQILESVERIIEATKASNPSLSSGLTEKTPSPAAGTSGDAKAKP